MSRSRTPEVEPLARADGLDLLGTVSGSGYEAGAALVRRADGQMVQLGPLLYTLLEEADGTRDNHELAEAMCDRLHRACDEQLVAAMAERLAQQGLLAGTEDQAPERVSPLLALRWKVVVTNPELTRRLTAPFTWLFRPWVVAPVLVAFAAVCWFVVVRHGVAAAVADAFGRPELILLLFALGVAAAAFHELGHASACRYGGGTPGAMGAGIYLVWPAFYTDVTDAYRLPKRDRLRTDLGGLYFNSIVAVVTVAAWWLTRADALLLLVALMLVEMVKQLSPVIRADGYHVLSDATGVPDLYAHVGPTLRRLLPWTDHAPHAALRGRARWLVTGWVLVIVPLLALMALGSILLLPRLAASTWVSGGNVAAAIGEAAADGDVIGLLVGALRMVALALPALGAVYIAWRVLRGTTRAAVRWSAGRPVRQAVVGVLAVAALGFLVWAWRPAGQYEPVHASDHGTLGDVPGLVAQPASGRAPAPSAGSGSGSGGAADAPTAIDSIPPGSYVAISLVPKDDPSEPVVSIITDPGRDSAPVMIASQPAEDPTSTEPAPTSNATAFSFELPDAPGEHDSQALAVNRTDGGVLYQVAYSLVTVRDGADVDERNEAYAFANCVACTTVAVSVQIVLVVGDSDFIAPVNVAEALNGNCPYCVTAAIARQLVVSIGSEPPPELIDELNAQLERLGVLDDPNLQLTPDEIVSTVNDVYAQVNQLLDESGLVAAEDEPATTADTTTPTTDTTPTTTEGTATQPTTTDPTTTTETTGTTADVATTSTTP
jgi:putative peptide zinc metalloprotease protein